MRPEEAAWDDLFQAQDFVERRFEEWSEKGLFGHRAGQTREFFANRRRNLEEMRQAGRPCPGQNNGLAPARANEPPASKSLRYWGFLAATVRRVQKEGLITLATRHALLDEIEGHREAIARRVNIDDLPEAAPAEDDMPPPPPPPPRRLLPMLAELAEEEPPAPARPLLEVILDPRNIQYLLVLGGALMVVGLVILLWINEVFTPPVVAAGLGAVNAAVLVLGWWLIRGTHLQTAGRALSLLACLVMPLNLWYLNANSDNASLSAFTIGGQLWVVAVVICALYAASAWVLKDEAFVYVLVAGLAGTGLLIIGKWPPSPDHFWEVVAPSSLLVVLGVVCIHAERAFGEGEEGPFTRKRFGLAFFWSGHVVMLGGLLLLLGAFVTGSWLHEAFRPWYESHWKGPSAVVKVGEMHWLALVLVLAAAYAYAYSDLVVRHVGVYVFAAAAALMWALVLVLEELNLKLGVEALIAVLSGMGLAVNLISAYGFKGSRYTRSFPLVGALLPGLAVLIGLVVYGQHVYVLEAGSSGPAIKMEEINWWPYVLAMALTAAACRVGAYLYRESAAGLAELYFLGTAAATLVGGAGLLGALNVRTWEAAAPVLMVVPVLYVVAAYFYQDGPEARPLVLAGHLLAGVLLASSLVAVTKAFHPDPELRPHLALGLFFTVGLVFYALAARLHRQAPSVMVAAALACGVAWQLFSLAKIEAEYHVLVFAAVGLVLVAGYRFELFGEATTETAFAAGNALLALSLGVGALVILGRLLGPKELVFDQDTGEVIGTVWLPMFLLALFLTAAAAAAVALVAERSWRRWYVVAGIGQALLALMVVTLSVDLTPAQKVRIFASLAGVVLLVAGHIGLAREKEQHSDLVSLGLFLGSLLVGVPQLIAGVDGRVRGDIVWYNEVAFFAAGVLLLTSGFMMQLKSTTLVGGLLTAAYFVTLLAYVPWSEMNAVAVTITIGGGVLFGLGLLLSVFRESLLSLPERIKNREGVFRVLNWR